ncbi:MAG: hypothetical protein ABEI77_05090 [Halorientalis sp.]
MPEPGWQTHGIAIGRQEFRRSLRSLRSDRTRLLFLAFGGLFLALFVVAGTYLVLKFGDRASSYPLTDAIRGSITIQWLFATYIFAQRAGSRHDHIDNESLMLMTVSVRSIAVGLVSADLFRALAYVTAPVVLIGGAFVYATASPLMVPFLVVAVLLFLCTALVAGYTIGLAAKLLAARIRFVARYKSILGVVGVIAFFVIYYLFQNTATSGLTAIFGLFPLSWLADLAVVGSPVTGSPARAVVAAVGSLGWILVWGVALERLARELWFGDSVENDVARAKARVDTDAGSDPLAGAASPIRFPALAQPTLRVAQRSVIVARRNPSRLTFVLLPVFVVGSSLINVAREGALFVVLPPILALVVPWLAGAAFGLNPLGDEGPVLTATLTSLSSGRQYALGLALPGLVLGLPLGLVTTVGASLYGPYTVIEIALLVPVVVIWCVYAVMTAPAIGMVFPRFDPVQVRSEREVVPPNLSAIIIYTLALVVPGAIALGSALAPETVKSVVALLVGVLFAVPFSYLASKGLDGAGGIATWLHGIGADIVGLPTAWVHWGGYALALLVVVGLSGWSVRVVTRRYERHTIA